MGEEPSTPNATWALLVRLNAWADRILKHLFRWIGDLPKHLDWLLGVGERLVALWLAFVIGSVAFRLYQLGDKELGTTAKQIGDHWQAMLILMLPFFYRVAREFIERARRGLGLEHGPPPDDENPPAPTPQAEEQ